MEIKKKKKRRHHHRLSYVLLLIHPPFGHKIDPLENNNLRVKHFHLGINWEGEKHSRTKNVGRWKMWEALVVQGVAGVTQLLPVGQLHLLLTFTSAAFHNQTIICLIANQNMEDMRHTDVLMNVLLGNLLPYGPGCSCGVTLCIGSQTHRETEDPYRCQPFNLFCNQS